MYICNIESRLLCKHMLLENSTVCCFHDIVCFKVHVLSLEQTAELFDGHVSDPATLWTNKALRFNGVINFSDLRWNEFPNLVSLWKCRNWWLDGE